MEMYLNTGIKALIDDYPEVADILNEYGIGCGACDVGTCLFKDIVSLHPLTEAQEKEMMRRIAAILNSNETNTVS